MKKKLMLLLFPLTVLCGCNSAKPIEKRNYVKGEEAVAIKQELSNKLKTATKDFSWEGIEEKLELSLSGNVDSLNEDLVTSTSTNFSISLSETTKAIFDENELKATTPNYAKAAKLESKTELELTASSIYENMPVSMKVKYNIDAKYGYATIKPVDSETPVSSDFLFVKTTASMSQGGDSQTVTSGSLGYGLAEAMVTSIKNQKPDSSSNVTINQDNLNAVLESLSNYVGYAKSKNKYYVSFDLSGLNSLTSAANTSLTFKGNIYAEIAFSKDDKISSINLEIKDASLTTSNAQAGIKALNLSLNGNWSIKEFKGNVTAPTQADVDAIGYNKISKIEITY